MSVIDVLALPFPGIKVAPLCTLSPPIEAVPPNTPADALQFWVGALPVNNQVEPPDLVNELKP